jgi:uncharacterized protein YkwD
MQETPSGKNEDKDDLAMVAPEGYDAMMKARAGCHGLHEQGSGDNRRPAPRNGSRADPPSHGGTGRGVTMKGCTELTRSAGRQSSFAAAAGCLLLALLCQPVAAQDMDRLRTEALEHVNDSRKEAGLATLDAGDALDAGAMAHAQDMLARDFYSHVTPEGEGPRDRFLEAGGAEWELVAENIAMCRNCSALDSERVAAFHKGWMDSAEHRANILAEGLARFGFGAAAGDGVIYAVQTFAGPGAARGDDRRSIGAGQASKIAHEMLNAARSEAGAEPVATSADLADAAEEALPENLAGIGLDELDLLGEASEGLRGFGRLQALVAACGGCGLDVTAGDARAFIEDWLGQDGRRATLLDPQITHAAMTVRSDGQGRKIAVLLLGAAR